MRFDVSPAQLKKMAHRMGSITPCLPLAQRTELLSRTLGFKSWGELSTVGSKLTGAPRALSFPLEGGMGNFIVGQFDEDSKNYALVRQFGTALLQVVGPSAMTAGDSDSELRLLSKLLWAIGATDEGVFVPRKRWDLDHLPAGRSPFFSLAKTDFPYPKVSGESGFGFGDRYDSTSVALESLEPFSIVREMNSRMGHPHGLSQVRINRFFSELNRGVEPPEFTTGKDGEHVLRVQALAAINASDENGRRCGLLLLEWALECPQDTPYATLTVGVRSALLPNDELVFLGWSAAQYMVADTLQKLATSAIGCMDAHIHVHIHVPKSSRQKATRRELEEMRGVGRGISSLVYDEAGFYPLWDSTECGFVSISANTDLIEKVEEVDESIVGIHKIDC